MARNRKKTRADKIKSGTERPIASKFREKAEAREASLSDAHKIISGQRIIHNPAQIPSGDVEELITLAYPLGASILDTGSKNPPLGGIEDKERGCTAFLYAKKIKGRWEIERHMSGVDGKQNFPIFELVYEGRDLPDSKIAAMLKNWSQAAFDNLGQSLDELKTTKGFDAPYGHNSTVIVCQSEWDRLTRDNFDLSVKWPDQEILPADENTLDA